MSKRIQERKTEGELAVAKPRSVCLISTNLNREQSSSFGPDASNVPVNPQRRETAATQKPKPSKVFSSVERRQTVSRELRETAAR